jgi:hypothetical protein
MIFIHLTLNPTKVKENEPLWGLGRAFLPVGLPKPIVWAHNPYPVLPWGQENERYIWVARTYLFVISQELYTLYNLYLFFLKRS